MNKTLKSVAALGIPALLALLWFGVLLPYCNQVQSTISVTIGCVFVISTAAAAGFIIHKNRKHE